MSLMTIVELQGNLQAWSNRFPLDQCPVGELTKVSALPPMDCTWKVKFVFSMTQKSPMFLLLNKMSFAYAISPPADLKRFEARAYRAPWWAKEGHSSTIFGSGEIQKKLGRPGPQVHNVSTWFFPGGHALVWVLPR